MHAPVFRCALALLSLALIRIASVSASPTVAQFDDCFAGNADLRLTVSTVYAQITESSLLGRHLNLTVLGESPQQIVGLANGSQALATLFTTTDALTFNVWTNNSYFCSTLRPPSPLSSANTSDYCPIPAGPFAFSSAIPLNGSNELLSLQTRLRAVDSLGNELLCIDANATPLLPGALDNVYGHARIILWATVALAAAFWLTSSCARLVTAWTRRAEWSGRGVWSRVESLGFVLASAISGEAFAKAPALLRFSTPALRDVVFHTQWCAAVAMVAVQWPQFVYPILTQTGWAMLSYNITIAQPSSRHWDPLSTPAFHPPSNFADQFSDANSPIFIDTNTPNSLFTLPASTPDGLASWIYAIGLYPQDAFGICMSVFLGIVCVVVVVSLAVWLVDAVASFIQGATEGRPSTFGMQTQHYSSPSKDVLDATSGGLPEDDKSAGGFLLRNAPRALPTPGRRRWSKLRPHFFGSFHFSILHGNLVRILVLFHFPITIFSSYQMTMSRYAAPISSIILAALSFAVFSIAIPVALVVRIYLTPTNKLYEETRTLLALGPLYSHYRHGSQLFAGLFFAVNVALGVTIGCGQRSGTAQAIVILVVEVISALSTSVWLPWGHGASMGLISFLFCVARIVVAVLLVTLTPTVSIGDEAGQWVAYVILFILGLIYLSLVLMLVCKFIEASVRIFGQVGFDKSRRTADSGLLGAFSQVGCFGARKKHAHGHRSRQSDLPFIRPNSHNAVNRNMKESTPTPSGPPSVLRPEHALRPYREDTDDESGFIMSAWHRPGYEALPNETTSPRLDSPDVSKSGFSRVGGGRAHFDTPYAIASGSTMTFPSIEQRPTPPQSQRDSGNFGLPLASTIGAEHTYNLPPGAMAPHVRTKSQTAIIENAAAGLSFSTSAPGRQLNLPDIIDVADNTEISDANQPRRKWYKWKPRRHSEGDDSGAPVLDDEFDDSDTGKNFLSARRKRRSSQPLTSTSTEPQTTDEGPPKKSFVVIRGKDNSSTGAGPSFSNS